MDQKLDDALRRALRDIADAPPPVGLATAARRIAGRQRAARMTLASVATAAVALVTVPAAMTMIGDRHMPGGAPPRSLVVTAYSGALRGTDAGPADDRSLLLDPETGRYEEVPYTEVVPSPDGRQVLVRQGDNSRQHPLRAGVMDRATGQVRWIDTYAGALGRDGEWSPDGRRILLTERPKQGPWGFVIVDASTLEATFVEAPLAPETDTLGLGFVWTPDGEHVALTLARNVGGELGTDAVTGIQFFDLSGRPVRTIEATGALSASTDFSPDGTRIALSDPHGGEEVQIVTATTGQVVERVLLPTPGVIVGWYDDDHLMVRVFSDRDSRADTLQVVGLDGSVLRTVRLLDKGIDAKWVYVGSSDGLSPAAARHAF